MSRIAILGGHGKVALLLAPILVADGHEVTSVFRNPDHEAEVAATGARPVVADIEHLDTSGIKDVLEMHDVVIWTAGAGGGSAERTFAVDRDAAIRSIDAARDAKVARYIQVSYKGARTDHGVPEDNSFFAYAEAKAAADAHLRKSDLDWTILGPSALTLEPGTGRIEVGAELESGEVPREDVAAVAAACIRKPGTIGQFIEFNTGGTPIEDALNAL